MSKFAEKLRCVYSGSTPPMGFRMSTEAEPAPLLMIAVLSKAIAKEAKGIADLGIAAGIVSSQGLDAKGFGQLAKAIGDIPLGAFWESADKETIAKSIDLGCDFVVFGLKTPLEAVNREGLGKILKIEPSLDQGLVRAINGLPLPIDGVLLTGEESPLTIEQLLIYRRFAELLDKPLLVTVRSVVTNDELSSLCEAGVNGLVLPEGFPTEAFAELKKSISSLSRKTKPRTKATALLPRVGGKLEAEVEEEEEEEI